MIVRTRSTPFFAGRRESDASGSLRIPRVATTPLLAVFALALVVGAPVSRGGEQRWLLRGTAEAELWRTDTDSILSSRDPGQTAAGGDVRLWFVADPHERVRLIAVGRIAGGRADGADGLTTALEQGYLRVTAGSRRTVFFDAGRLPNWLGNASERYLSHVNPLVGSPFGYTRTFPLGVRLSGALGRFDYRLGMVDGPRIDERFLPAPGADWRPAIAVGVTPFRGMRVGAYATRGAYLSPAHQVALAAGERWSDFDQQVTGLELRFSRRYLELNADYSRARHDVPTLDRPLEGRSGFVELSYVLRPRWFAALRASHHSQITAPQSKHPSWPQTTTRFNDLEIGAGYRASPDTLIKLTYRQTKQKSEPSQNGRALTAQLTHTFNLRNTLTPPTHARAKRVHKKR